MSHALLTSTPRYADGRGAPLPPQPLTTPTLADLEALAEQLLLISNEVSWMKEVPKLQASYISLQTALIARRIAVIARGVGEAPPPVTGLSLDLEPFSLVAERAPSAHNTGRMS